MAKKVYAIKEGFDKENNKKIVNVIVDTWAECQRYVTGVKGAKYKSFENIEDAKRFISDGGDILNKKENDYPKEGLHIYVDGSYNVSTEEYSYGMVAVENDVVLHIESGYSKSDDEVNIRQIAGELEGAIKAVEYALTLGKDQVVIFHDYIGIANHATGLWERKDKSSIEYYNKMQALMAAGIKVIFVKVDSHTGDFFNELVDEKCKEELGIPSEKVVESWLSRNVLRVYDNTVKKQISTIAPRGVKNLIVINKTNSEENDTIEDNIKVEEEISTERLLGRMEERKAIIINMLNSELPIEMIENYTKVSIREIENIRREM